jgi:lysophospholipase L1-like esterase
VRDQGVAAAAEPTAGAAAGAGAVSPRRRATRAWSMAGKALVLLLAAGLGVALGEGGLRLFFPHLAPRTATISQFWRYDPALGWAHVPNATGSFSAFGSTTPVSINAKGFRDRERSYARAPSTYRIVVLGDSLVWGYGVHQGQIFTALMEQQRANLEVVNLGVSGYGTDQELLLFRQEGHRYRPDLTVVLLVENDFTTNVRRSYVAYPKPMFEVSRDGGLSVTNTPVPRPRRWQRTATRLVRHSFLLNLALSTSYRLWAGRPLSSPMTAAVPPRLPFPRNPEEEITAALLLELRRAVEQAGSDFLLVLDSLGSAGDELERFFAARNVRVLNLEPDLSRGERRAFHLPDGVHWSARGHDEVAGRLLRYLDDQRLIRPAAERRAPGGGVRRGAQP